MISAPSSFMTRVVGATSVRKAVNRGFHLFSSSRMAKLSQSDSGREQKRVLAGLLGAARQTKFGRDHQFEKIRSIADYQDAVPLRQYESLWNDYFQDAYPVFQNLTWPGKIRYFALTSGTTLGKTKHIPVSSAMLASNQKAAQTMIAGYLANRPSSRLFHGKLFFLGGSTALEQPAPGVAMGDLSAIANINSPSWLGAYAFPPPQLALESDWDRKLDLLAERSLREPIRMVAGVPSWLLVLFDRVLEISGKSTIAEVWPDLELVIHGGVVFDPYRSTFIEKIGSSRVWFQECYPCSEGFIAYGDAQAKSLRLMYDHGIFYEFVPVSELHQDHPPRFWLGNVETGVNYAIVVSTCAGLWSHMIGDVVRFESLHPPRIVFAGRTKYNLSAFGEHLEGEEIELALMEATKSTSSTIREWHVGPVFQGGLGHHRYLIEFQRPPKCLKEFAKTLDRDLCRRNADYHAHRIEGVSLSEPEILAVPQGGFERWMRSRGKLGGQHKVPRVDGSGAIGDELLALIS